MNDTKSDAKPVELEDMDALREHTCETIRKTAFEVGSMIERLHGPVWSAQIDLLKTLIQLSSGALVLTVTFSGSILNASQTPVGPWVLFLGWLCFSVTTVTALLGVWQGTELRSFPARLHDLTPDLWKAIESSIVTRTDPFPAIRLLLRRGGYDINIKPCEKRLRWALTASFSTFVAGILCLALFGWKQFQ